MKVVIAGGTGFIGEILARLLVEAGYDIVILSRTERHPHGKVKYIRWLAEGAYPEKEIRSAEAFINLAGVSINEGRWTKNHQKKIYESRMTATNELIRIITQLSIKPAVLVNASAIGIYPPSQTMVYSEKSIEIANDFLGKTVRDWEKTAARVSDLGVRTAFMRFGVVLGNDGGALPLMVMPYKLFAGGTIGSGKQWVSWVHATDAARAIVFAVKNKTINGPVNVTAPDPKRMSDFGKTIGSVLHRPHWFPVPASLMKIVLGKKSYLVLEGQHVVPEVLRENDFVFQFPTLESALKNLLC